MHYENTPMHYTPRSNLTYLAPPGQFFMGAKSLIGTPEMQKKFVLKDKLVCTVSMATVNVIFEDGGVHTKLVISPLLFILDH